MRLKFTIILIGAALTVGVLSGAPRLSPWDAWRMAYTTFEQGEELRDKGNYVKAREAFDKALEYYRMVRSARPDWNQKVIAERIADCERESQKMRNFLGPETPKVAAQPQEGSGESTSSPESESLRRQLSEVRAELEELRRKNSTRVNYESEIANLLRDQRVLNERYSLLERRYRDLESKLAAPDTRVGALEEQLVALRLQLDLARRENDAAKQQSSIARSETARARNELQAAENARRLAENRNTSLQNQLNALRGENEKQAAELSTGARQLRELEAALSQSRSRGNRLEKEFQALQSRYVEKLQTSKSGEAVNMKLAEEVGRFQKELAALRKNEQQLTAALRKMEHESELLRQSLSGERSKGSASQAEAAALKQRNAALQAELEREKANTVILNREVQTLRNSENAGANELKTLKTENAALKDRLKFRESEEFKNLTAANAEKNKLRAELLRAEQQIAALKGEVKLRGDKAGALERANTELQSENRKLHAERIDYEERVKRLTGASSGAKELSAKYEELRKNFTALQAENRRNRLAAEAAKPREAELARIKLRLAELDDLKQQLSREQSFNEQLNAVKNRLEQEIKLLRPMGRENAELKQQLSDLKMLRSEVERLRKLNAELAAAKQLESEVAALKVQLAQTAPAAAEAAKLKQRNLELEQGRALWENEIAKLRAQLARFTQIQEELQKLRGEAARKDEELQKASVQIAKLAAEAGTLEKSVENLETLRTRSRRLIDDQARTLEQLRASENSVRRLKREAAARQETLKELQSALKQNEETLLKLRAEQAAERAAQAAAMQKAQSALRSSEEQLKQLQTVREAENAARGIEIASQAAMLKKLQSNLLESQAQLAQMRGARTAEGAYQAAALKKLQDSLKESDIQMARLRKAREKENAAHAATLAKLQTSLRESKAEMARVNSEKQKEQKAGAAYLAVWEKRFAELQEKEREHLSENDRLRRENGLLKDVNARNNTLEQDLAEQRSINARLRAETEQMAALRRELARAGTRLTELGKESDVLRKHNRQLLNVSAESQRLQEELKTLRRLNNDLAERRLKAESTLASLQADLGDLNRLKTEAARLRKVNAELAGAANLAPELAQAKVRIAQLEQMRDELNRQRQLNEELSNIRRKLESELASRPPLPAFASSDYVAGDPVKPVGKAEDYITAGKLAEKDEKTDLAVWNYRTALKLAPDNVQAAELLGKALAARGDYAAAAPLLSRARSGRPDSIDLALDTAYAYIALRRYGNADAVIAPLLKRHRDDPRLQMAAAMIASGNGKYAEAAGLLRLAEARLPKDPTPKLELARLLLATDATRQFEAVKLYEAARRLGAGPDPEIEPKIATLLDSRRNTSEFLNSAAAEAAGNKDWNSVIWYTRQLIDLDREPEKYRPRLAFAQYKKGSSAAALETLSMGRPTALGMLVKAFIHLQRGEKRESGQCALQARALSGGSLIELPLDWPEFNLEFRKSGAPLKYLVK